MKKYESPEITLKKLLWSETVAADSTSAEESFDNTADDDLDWGL